MTGDDRATAAAFAESWNHIESVYSREQFLEWLAPLDPQTLEGKEVLELGFGNGSLLAHMGTFAPRRLAGVELGETMARTLRNLAHLPPSMLDLRRGDLTTVDAGTFDLVYCIGVLHHLADPKRGFEAVLRHTKPGGRFHCWVYAHEGNGIIRMTVEPLRRITSKLPWWLTKYAIALPLVLPYVAYSKLIARVPRLAAKLPLGAYSLWIARAPLRFFHHVAFDQLVTPRTAYIRRETIDQWLRDERIDPATAYLIFRNGNSWKFGGRRKDAA